MDGRHELEREEGGKKKRSREGRRWRGRWKKRVLTGKNAQWGSGPCIPTNKQSDVRGRLRGRSEGGHRNRNLKVNVGEVHRKKGLFCAPATGAEDKDGESWMTRSRKEEMNHLLQQECRLHMEILKDKEQRH